MTYNLFLFLFTLQVSSNYLKELRKYCSEEDQFFQQNENLVEILYGEKIFYLDVIYQNSGRMIRGPFMYNGKEAVLKVIDASGFGSEQLVQEVRLMKKLNKDEQFMVMYDCYLNQSPEGVFQVNMILEKLGKDMRQMNKKLLSKTPQEKAQLYINLAQDYIDLHNKYEIIHSDLKPDNIVSVDNDISKMKIIDFGVSCEIGTKDCGGNIISFAYEKFYINNVTFLKEFETFSFAVLLCQFEQSDDDYFKIAAVAPNIIKLKAQMLEQCNKEETFDMKFKDNFTLEKFNQKFENFSDIYKLISNPDIDYRKTLEEFVEIMKEVEFEDQIVQVEKEAQEQKNDTNDSVLKIRL